MELPILQRAPRILTSARLPCLGRMPMLRLASGCVYGCRNCFAEGVCGSRGAGEVAIVSDVVLTLRSEIARRRSRPAAVCLDFASDPFQGVPELLDRTYEALEYLLSEGIGVVLQTKANIPSRHMELLLAHAPLVRAIIPLVTTDRRTVRIFEPPTTRLRVATPRTRLRQMRQFVDGGVATLARVDPILPGVTDDPDTMHGLCAALAEAGIHEIAAGVLVLRPAIVNALRKRLGRPQLYQRLVQAFDDGRKERLPGFQSAVRALPAAQRRRIFQWLTTIAGQYGIRVHVCACKNPDPNGESCRLAGQWSPPQVVERQRELFA